MKEIFARSQYSVVELKANSGADTVSYGSAVFIANDGTLVSNAHMVVYKKSGIYQEFKKYDIRFAFEAEYREISLIKYDLAQDIAVLKLNRTDNVKFKAIKKYDCSKLKSGDTVYAVGNGMNHGIGITQA